ncbi:sortase [Georgenia alba]|uniref:Sortase n=1 Tax=Georgenia alba TaxID=2233858 RepID=A0ABW2QAU0_9MICO
MSTTGEAGRRPRLLIALVVAVVLVLAGGVAALALRSEPATRGYAAVERPEPPQPEPAPSPEPQEPRDPLADLVVPEPVSEGETFGTMRVPKWRAEFPVNEGISDAVLNSPGVGRFPTSQMPGAEGNFAMAGHRTLHSAPLYRINELEVGDEIIVTTDDGEYTYTVSEYEIVSPDQVRVIEEDPHNPGGPAVGRLLTLVACHPLGSTAQRWITYAELESFEAA